MCEKAPGSGADLVFLDLEDACAPVVKESARAIAVNALTGQDWGRTVRAVRVNGLETPWCYGDVVEIVTGARDSLDVIIVPKARSARDVWWFDVLLTQLETKLGLKKRIGSGGADRGGRRTLERGRDRPGQRPPRSDHLRSRRPLGLAARPGGRQLRSSGGLPRRLLALRPRPDPGRGPGSGNRRHRRALSRPTRTPTDTGAPPSTPACWATTANGPSIPARSPSPTTCSPPPTAEIADAEESIAIYRKSEAEGVGAIGRDGKLVDAAHMRLAANVLYKAALVESERSES